MSSLIPMVEVSLCDAQTGHELPSTCLQSAWVFSGLHGNTFNVLVYVTRPAKDERTYLLELRIDGTLVNYVYHLDIAYCKPRITCSITFEGFASESGQSRKCFEFNTMMVTPVKDSRAHQAGSVEVCLYERGKLLTNNAILKEPTVSSLTATEKDGGKYFENQKLATVAGMKVKPRTPVHFDTVAYEKKALITSTTILYDDASHIQMRSTSNKKVKSVKSQNPSSL